MAERWTKVVATAVVAGGLLIGGLGGPAASEDSAPPRPGQSEGSCASPFGGLDTPNGSMANFPPGTVGPPPTFLSGNYVCINGSWVFVSPNIGPMGPVFMVGAPDLSVDEATVTVPEGATATNSGFVGDGGTDPVTLLASIGTITRDGLGNWSWSLDTSDGPVETQQVLISADAGGRAHIEPFDLVVENVAPTVTSVTPSATTVLPGQPVTFTGAATDPSAPDTTAGFAWSFDGGSAGTLSFDTCGSHTVSATAMDKDGGTSEPVDSTTVTVVDAQVAAPLSTGAYNAVQAGQVVPVKLDVGCGGASVAGLAPRLSVLAGDVDPTTEADDPTLTVPVTSSNGADTAGVMRPSGDSYVYNLRVPSGVAGALYTVRIRPFEGSPAVISIVLKIRK